MVDERGNKGKREKRRQRDLKIGRRGNIDEYTRI